MTKRQRTETVQKTIDFVKIKKMKLNIIIYRDMNPEKNIQVIKEARRTLKELNLLEKEFLQHDDVIFDKIKESGKLPSEDYEEFTRLLLQLIDYKV